MKPARPASEGDHDAERRQCGRCRRSFDGDPTLPGKPTGFWLCWACREILLPDR